MKIFPRVLVISNNCFSKTDSNGRTLRNFFLPWPKENLAQFFIQNAKPDYDVCKNYYRVTDVNVIKSLLGKKVQGKLYERPSLNKENNYNSYAKKRRSRTSLSMLARNFIWDLGSWKTSEFDIWIEEFSPEVILFHAGDCAFMMKIARKISEKYGIPVVVYNTEGYYFKNFDYFRTKGIAHIFYPLFIYLLRKQFKKLQEYVKYNIYSCGELKKEYDALFNTPSEVIYTSTTLENEKKLKEITSLLKISYLGNLGVGRHKMLIEVANIINKINPQLKLDVYGKLPDYRIKKEFDSSENIRYNGMVPYEETIRVIKNSDIILHVESFDDFYREDLKFAFSTKIADSLASGTAFLLYAPENVAASMYLRANNAAYVVSDRESLYETFKRLINNPEDRSRYLDKAFQLVDKNHNYEKNANRFTQILSEVCEK